MLQELKRANESLTTTEAENRLGVISRTAHSKSPELSKNNPTVIRKEVGASAVIWYNRH